MPKMTDYYKEYLEMYYRYTIIQQYFKTLQQKWECTVERYFNNDGEPDILATMPTELAELLPALREVMWRLSESIEAEKEVALQIEELSDPNDYCSLGPKITKQHE